MLPTDFDEKQNLKRTPSEALLHARLYQQGVKPAKAPGGGVGGPRPKKAKTSASAPGIGGLAGSASSQEILAGGGASSQAVVPHTSYRPFTMGTQADELDGKGGINTIARAEQRASQQFQDERQAARERRRGFGMTQSSAGGLGETGMVSIAGGSGERATSSGDLPSETPVAQIPRPMSGSLNMTGKDVTVGSMEQYLQTLIKGGQGGAPGTAGKAPGTAASSMTRGRSASAGGPLAMAQSPRHQMSPSRQREAMRASGVRRPMTDEHSFGPDGPSTAGGAGASGTADTGGSTAGASLYVDTPDNWINPRDFVEFINQHEQLADEFCYMNRCGPYEFQIIPFSRINPDDYMTISGRGVTHFCHGDLTFITLQQWEIEQELYGRISKIGFFKRYPRWKMFSSWRKVMLRQRKNKCAKTLNQNLFMLDATLQVSALAFFLGFDSVFSEFSASTFACVYPSLRLSSPH